MPIITTPSIITLTAGGGTVNLDIAEPVDIYFIRGTATLTSNWTIQSSNVNSLPLIAGVLYNFKYEADITLDGNTITIFGQTLPPHVADKNMRITAYYNGSVWIVEFIPDVNQNNIIDYNNLLENGFKLLPTVTTGNGFGEEETMLNGDPSPVVVNTPQSGYTPISKLYYKAEPFLKTVHIVGYIFVEDVNETTIGSLQAFVMSSSFMGGSLGTSNLGQYINFPLKVEYSTSSNETGSLAVNSFIDGYLQKNSASTAFTFKINSDQLGNSTAASYRAYVNITIPYGS